MTKTKSGFLSDGLLLLSAIAVSFLLSKYVFAQSSKAVSGFHARFLVSNAHSVPLLLELGLKTKQKTESFILDSRISTESKIAVAPWIPSVIAQEVREQEKVFARWKERKKDQRLASCRETLELTLVDGSNSGTWHYCIDITEKDPQAQVARRWLNFVDQSVREQINPNIESARRKVEIK
jgi:hypothetical protein